MGSELRRRRHKIARVGLSAGLVAGTLLTAPVSAAQAAAPFPVSAMYATQANSSNIVSVDRTTGAATNVLEAPGGAIGLNQLGLSGDGGTVILTNATSVFEYTAATETWATTPRTVAVPNTMGGVDPHSGLFYFGGRISRSTFSFATYDPASNAISTNITTVTADTSPGANGDLAFDSRGNLYFAASSSTEAQIYRVNAADLGGAALATAVGPLIDAGVALNSLAFANDGYLYIAGGGTNGFLRVDPVTGDVLERRSVSVAITDLGTNAVPFTGDLKISLPQGRVKDTDQFTVTIGGGGIEPGVSGTTSGSETSATVGPILLLPGKTYTITQEPEGTTDPRDYVTAWSCVDPATGAVVASGPGASGQFTIPDGVNDVVCTFSTNPKATGRDDTTQESPPGQPVTVDVLGNDLGALDPTSVRIVSGGVAVTELVVPGEGTWTVNPTTGAITFSPESGFLGDPTPITYSVSDTAGNTSQARLAVTFQSAARDDASLGNPPGQVVTLDVAANDFGALDPTSVRIVSGGVAVTELVVPGEGTWTVNPTTGAITFSPENGFLGDPTPISYSVTDTDGDTTQATVTVTYGITAENDQSLNNPQGQPVTVSVTSNDHGDLDPGTVRILDGSTPVMEFPVEGEGVWSVDAASGKITFTPARTFTGDPTPITYRVADTAGNIALANVTVTFVAAAPPTGTNRVGSGALAFTGSNPMTALVAAIGLTLLGGLLIRARRRPARPGRHRA